MSSTLRRRGYSLPTARCEDCDWELDTINSHGVGVQHARKHRHVVRIEVDASHVYIPEEHYDAYMSRIGGTGE